MKKILIVLFWALYCNNLSAAILQAGDTYTLEFNDLTLTGPTTAYDTAQIYFTYGTPNTSTVFYNDFLYYEDILDTNYFSSNFGSSAMGCCLGSQGFGITNPPWQDLNGKVEIKVFTGFIDIQSISIRVVNEGLEYQSTFAATPVPIPPTLLLFISGLFTLITVTRKRTYQLKLHH